MYEQRQRQHVNIRTATFFSPATRGGARNCKVGGLRGGRIFFSPSENWEGDVNRLGVSENVDDLHFFSPFLLIFFQIFYITPKERGLEST